MSLAALSSRHLAIAATNAAWFRSGPEQGGESPSGTAPKSARLSTGPVALEGGSTVKGWAPVGRAGNAGSPGDDLVAQPLPSRTSSLRIRTAPWLWIPTLTT